MDLLSCPCLSHRVHMFLSAGDTAFCKRTPAQWRDKQQSRWDRTTPLHPCGLFEIRKSVLKKHSKHLPADRLCTLVQCKAGSLFWEPVHESVMNQFDSKGALKKRTYFWFRWGIKKVLYYVKANALEYCYILSFCYFLQTEFWRGKYCSLTTLVPNYQSIMTGIIRIIFIGKCLRENRLKIHV